MGISAFNIPPMPKDKEKDKMELRLVSEDDAVDEAELPYTRLNQDGSEEVEEWRPVRVEVEASIPRTRLGRKDEFKVRSKEQDLAVMSEREIPAEVEPWDVKKVSGATLPWRWVTMLVACVFAGAILWSLSKLKEVESKKLGTDEFLLSTREQEEAEVKKAEMQIRALEVAALGFFDARSIEEMLRYVRHPDQVRPRMERYFNRPALEPVPVASIVNMLPLTIGKSTDFWMVVCKLEGGVECELLVELISETEARVDWEEHVCYQPMEWDDFARTRPGGYTGNFRVYVEKDHFYSHEFSDSTMFESYRLTTLDSEEVLFGYLPRGSASAQRMAKLIEEYNGATPRLILRLHIPQGIMSRKGVEIHEIVNSNWISPSPTK